MNFFNDFFSGTEDDFHYVSAKACLSIAKNIEALMDEQQITKSKLAELLGTSRPYVSTLLRGDANITIETLAKLSIALDAEIKMALISKSKFKELDKKLTAFMRFDSAEKVKEKMRKSWVESVSPSNDESYTRLRLSGGAAHASTCQA